MRILIILLSFSFAACGQQPKKYVMKPEAKILADSAYKFVVPKQGDTVNFQSAINLLKQATEIDSNYILGFRNLLSYQQVMKDYKGALETAKRMYELRPQNPEFSSSLGIMYELNADTISSKQYFQKSLDIYSKLLDTLSDQNTILQIKSAKALNLLFLNRYQEGQEILNQIIKSSNDPIEKEGLKIYLNKSGREIIMMILTGEENQSVSPSQQ
ncbi:tetratricopeptide repeat protein [Ferruginibacter yonginensis]|uniref:Tetratricopeptide repeat protein n=1 Tax=Ferruginibacter yonginensis TaxID=1310416 RepID=A0ABV8QVN4_9BACT